MDSEQLRQLWLENYKTVPESLEKVKEITNAATAFNTNIDAVIKISGKQIAEFLRLYKLSYNELMDIKSTKLDEPKDVIRGIFKCFSRGIAEEWVGEDIKVYQWLVANIGYDRLQMGGQGGIVANVLAVAGVQKVYAHTSSLPKLQAEQFLALDNLYSFDEKACEKPAYMIDRNEDIPLIHWIIEFDKDDNFDLEGHNIRCPRSNRFIATYDPLNINLAKEKSFVEKALKTPMDFIILSGFHALTENKNGLNLISDVVPFIKEWKEKSKNGILHLEIASTQDMRVRKAIVEQIASLVDSIGINERETIDILEVIGHNDLAETIDKNPHSSNLFAGIIAIKKYTKCSRIQLHTFGLYLTVQDKNFSITPEANRRGMALASIVAASKAGTGHINSKENLLWAFGREVGDVGLFELQRLAKYLADEKLLSSGISSFDGFDIIAVPTIIIDKPKTLVGMGDTISSVSLVGANGKWSNIRR